MGKHKSKADKTSKATPLSSADRQLFIEAMRNVTPLENDTIPVKPLKVKPIPQQRYREETAVKQDMLSDAYDPADLETGEELIFMRDGVQHNVMRKLRRGAYSVRAELDLHGMVVPEARAAVAGFLRYCQQHNIRCVRIIHGKGYGSWQKLPVLKNKLNKWLQQRDEVIAFCSARSVDGGTGAIYVLLKRR